MTIGCGAVPATSDSITVEDSPMLHAIMKHDFEPGLSSVEGSIVCHVAGFVVKKALDCNSPSACQEALVNVVHAHDMFQPHHLLGLRCRGGLMTLSAGVG